MKRLTREWAEKAEGDFMTAQRESRVRKAPNYDAVCFHSQQCAEKYRKALLQELDIPFSKTHNLIALLELLGPRDREFDFLRPCRALETNCIPEIPRCYPMHYPIQWVLPISRFSRQETGLEFLCLAG